ncbi:MAG: HlyD family secretion protein [Chlamydiota bacterium]
MTLSKRQKLSWGYGSACLLVLIIVFLLWVFIYRFREYTSDAYVEGNQVFITPLRPGFITAIHTDDTFLVKRGQLLIELDETDAVLALEKKKQELARAVRLVCEAFHQMFSLEADIEIKRAELIRASQDFEHRYNVLEAGGVSLEDYEHSVAALRASFYGLRLTESLYEKALSYVQGTSIYTHPEVQAAAETFREAWVQHYRCKIYAPLEGLTAQRKIQVGMWVHAGDPLFSVIPLNQIWVNANFKETQMKKMRIGQKVKLTSDYYGDDVVFHGKIVGLPGGAGNAFSLLPPQNLSGNWIKIVQRLPVRVSLDPEELKNYPLRIGLSMEAIVDLHDQEGERVPTSSLGSPNYETTIYKKEELGDKEVVDMIIFENIDPKLAQYAEGILYPLRTFDEQ